MEINGNQNYLFTNIHHNIFFCDKESRIGLKPHKGTWHIFNFCVKCPFKLTEQIKYKEIWEQILNLWPQYIFFSSTYHVQGFVFFRSDWSLFHCARGIWIQALPYREATLSHQFRKSVRELLFCPQLFLPVGEAHYRVFCLKQSNSNKIAFWKLFESLESSFDKDFLWRTISHIITEMPNFVFHSLADL